VLRYVIVTLRVPQ